MRPEKPYLDPWLMFDTNIWTRRTATGFAWNFTAPFTSRCLLVSSQLRKRKQKTNWKGQQGGKLELRVRHCDCPETIEAWLSICYSHCHLIHVYRIIATSLSRVLTVMSPASFKWIHLDWALTLLCCLQLKTK